METEKIVQEQLDAYNRRDLNKFLSFYSEEIEIHNFLETKPFISGQSELKKIYEKNFETSPDLNARIKNRIIFDNKVIDYEQVSGKIGIDLIEAVVIYELKNSLIDKVYFIRKQ